MAERYTGWHARSGEVDASPEARDAGKKLLGEIANSIKLGGPPTQVRRVLAPTGELVESRMTYGQPSVQIGPPPPGGGTRPKIGAVGGIVTKPRKFGTGAANDGQNAYGQFAHNALIPREDGWSTSFYDDSYKPEGYESAPSYRITSDGHKLFDAGLAIHGNVDWKTADGLTCITWVGPAGRMAFITNAGSPYIYHNGRVVVDHSAINFDHVYGACVRQFPEGLYIVYVATHQNTDTLRVYAAPVTPDLGPGYEWLEDKLQGDQERFAPQWLPVPAGDIVELASFTLPADGTLPTGARYFAFNAAGTEARAIAAQRVAGASSEHLRFCELVLTIGAPVAGGATLAVLSRGEYAARSPTRQTFDRCIPNFYNPAVVSLEYDLPAPGPTTPLGTFEATSKTQYNVTMAMVGTGLNPNPRVLVAESTLTTSTETDNAGPFPIAVDYQDEVPVYLWWVPETTAAFATRACDWTQEETGSGSGSTTYVQRYAGETPDGTIIGASTTHTEYAQTASGTRMETFVESSPRPGEVYALDKAGVRWLDIRYDIAGTGSVTATANLVQATSYTVDYELGDLIGDTTGERSSSYSSDYSSYLYRRQTSPTLWFLDLRSRSAAYSLYTHETTQTNDVSVSCTATEAIDNNSNTVQRYPLGPRTTDGINNTHVARSIDTRVVFAGTEVRRMTVTPNAAPAPIVTSSTVEYVPSPGDVAFLTFSDYGTPFVRVLFGGINDNFSEPQRSEAAALEDTFWSAAPPGSPPWDDPLDMSQSGAITAYEPPESWYYYDIRIEVEDVFAITGSNPLVGDYSWVRIGADLEPTTGAYAPRYNVRLGTWIYHQQRWAYSMPDLDRPDAVTSATKQYTHGISHGGDLVELTGARPGVELFEAMWPLSTSVVQIK